MAENFIFKALFISLTAHTVILCAAFLTKINNHHYAALKRKQVEITYRPMRRRQVDIRQYPIRPSQRLDLSNNRKLFDQGTVPVSLGHEKSMLPFRMFDEHKPEHFSTMELNRRVFIKPITSAKINNPVYALYNEMIRDRIKEKVYANYDRMEAGVVYLTFLLDKHGVLRAARIIPGKTNASEHLQEISMRSLRQASPFPPFLKGMNLEEYSFNIEIQYQVND
ncbi:MAG: hypothetical protein KGK03_06305 [Candidatus Omnitrophica bacterium]|nr:hypothetical protein [Candidatus Omnitrophota bacterium]